MHTILGLLKRHFPFVTKRAATEDEFYDFCQRKNIEVVFTSEIRVGLYVRHELLDTHTIFLNSRLSGWRLRYVMFHELGHYLFHVPGQTRRGAVGYGWSDMRKHAEAEATAAYMLLTIDELQRGLADTDFKPTKRVAELVALRIDLHTRYGE